MSQLVIKGHRGKEFKLNVTQFRSPMSASITSVQTRTMMQHFPIRAGQPDINFTVRFASIQDKHDFQAFVRDHQTYAQSHSGEKVGDGGLITLWWPERNIENWTGYIVEFRVVETRFIYAPAVTFGVSLIDSLMSERTTISSFGSSPTSIWGPQIPAWQVTNPGEPESDLVPPTPPSSQTPVPTRSAPPVPTTGR